MIQALNRNERRGFRRIIQRRLARAKEELEMVLKGDVSEWVCVPEQSKKTGWFTGRKRRRKINKEQIANGLEEEIHDCEVLLNLRRSCDHRSQKSRAQLFNRYLNSYLEERATYQRIGWR